MRWQVWANNTLTNYSNPCRFQKLTIITWGDLSIVYPCVTNIVCQLVTKTCHSQIKDKKNSAFTRFQFKLYFISSSQSMHKIRPDILFIHYMNMNNASHVWVFCCFGKIHQPLRTSQYKQSLRTRELAVVPKHACPIVSPKQPVFGQIQAGRIQADLGESQFLHQSVSWDPGQPSFFPPPCLQQRRRVNPCHPPPRGWSQFWSTLQLWVAGC